MLATGYTGSAMQIADCWLVPQTKYRLQPAATGNAPFDTPLDDLPESDLGQLKRLSKTRKELEKPQRNPEYARLFLCLLNHLSSRIFPDSVKIVCESKMDSVISVWKLAREIAPRVFRERRQRIFIGFSKGKPAARNALCIEAITPGQWPA